MLLVEHVTKNFLGLTALQDVSFSVSEGTIHALIGPNGAGKTTLFNLISGVIRPTAGRIVFEDRDLGQLGLPERAKLGIARTFQNIRLFAGMTVIENVMCGMHSRLHVDPIRCIAGIGAGRREEIRCRDRSHELLEFVGLEHAAYTVATTLSYGDQRRVEIARALACDPQLLLLDEPAAGMNVAEADVLADLIRTLRERKVTLLIVEHDMHFLMKLSDQLTVLNFGRVLAQGSPGIVRNHPEVIAAYLGSTADVTA